MRSDSKLTDLAFRKSTLKFFTVDALAIEPLKSCFLNEKEFRTRERHKGSAKQELRSIVFFKPVSVLKADTVSIPH